MSSEKLEEAYKALYFINELVQCQLPRRQVKRLIRYIEKLQVKRIDFMFIISYRNQTDLHIIHAIL